ncbi:hypothetical protein HYU93_01245 [Candidatus Daviesbacteria bacterium]|nr:hypothetical protein [Candidatus Daviesbacteria bacterium]
MIIIPIIHTAADMMSLQSAIPREEQDEQFALAEWEKIFGYLHSLSAGFVTGLRVYQDGLPDTSGDNLNKIFAQAPGKNYEVLRWLRSNGAIVMGTESTELMREEYKLLVARYHAPNGELWAQATLEYAERRGRLLMERNAYIAQRIDHTLMPGEAGLLFIGLGHNIQPLLADKMRLGQPRIFNPDRILAEWRGFRCQNV